MLAPAEATLNGALAYTTSSYHLGRQYEALDANGTTRGVSASVSYPFLLKQSMAVTGTLNASSTPFVVMSTWTGALSSPRASSG